MPVDAIQWRVSVGMGNAGRVCPAKWRRKLHLVKPTMEVLCYWLMVSMATVVLPLLFLLDKGPPGQIVYVGGSLCKSCVQAGYRIGRGFAWSTGVSGFCLQSHLQALSLLLVVAGDVEQNPGPLSEELLAGVDDTELTEDETQDVYRAVLDLAGMWRDMGFALGLRPAVVDMISATHCGNPKQCLREVIIKWLRKTYDVDRHGLPRWRTLVKAVSDKAGGDNPALAEEIAKEHTAKYHKDASSSSNSCPGYVAKYADHLREKYRRLQIFPRGSEWPPSVGEYDTQVALIEREKYLRNSSSVTEDMSDIVVGQVDRIVGRKCSISMEDIFAPTAKTGHELKVLIDGAPGVGKTTLTHRFVKDWAEGKLLSAYEFVLLLPLRDRRIAQAGCISELFYHDDPELRDQVASYVCKTRGANIMLIFDGFDELSLSQRKEGSLLLDIICGEKLLHCSVIVTSRPYASEAIQRLQSLSRHVEVLGFTEQQIEHCITNSIPDTEKAQALIQQLSERQDLISLCYIPLNCAIMVFVYKYKSYTLPDTITQLYEAFLVNTLKRHVDKYNEELGKRVQSLDQLPNSQLQECLQALSKLAFEGLENDQSTFYFKKLEAELSRITSEGDLHSKLLGIMNVFHSTSGVGIKESYQFLHRTVQEFLAARYASELPVNNQLSFFKKQIANSNFNIGNVVLFFAGLTKLADPAYQQYFESEVSFRLLGEPDSCKFNKFGEPSSTLLQRRRFFLGHLRLVYEAQNIELCRVLPKCVEDENIVMSSVPLSPFYCRVLAYCLLSSGYCWKSLDLRDCNLSDCCLEAFKNVKPSEASGFVKEVIFSSATAMPSLFATIFSFAGLSLLASIPLFQHVEVLQLDSFLLKPVNGLTDGFAKLLQMKSLVRLSLSFILFRHRLSNDLIYTKSGLGRERVQCRLLESPTQISPSLQTLNLIMTEPRDLDEMKCLAISLGESNVTKLHLCVQVCLVSVMFPSLLSMKNLETLSLGLQYIDPFIVQSHLEGLQKMLETSGTLKNLKLFIMGCMTEVDFQSLADGLSVNRALTSFNFSSLKEFCELSPIFKALQLKKKLERLHIQSTRPIDTRSKSEFSPIFKAFWQHRKDPEMEQLQIQRTRPIELNVDSRPESDLQEALKSNACLQNVSLIGMRDNEVKYVADGLIDHPSLQSIEIARSVVETPTASCLLRALHSCPALHSVRICSRLTACSSQVHDETGSESEIGDLAASLLQERFLVLDIFSHLRPGPFVMDPFKCIGPTGLPNTRLIVEGLCKNFVAHYPFLKSCGFAMLQFHCHCVLALFEFEPLQHGEPGGLDSTLLSMEWESVNRIASFETIRAYQEARQLKEGEDSGKLEKQTALIGVRIRIDNKRIDLLLKVVEGVCWTKHSDILTLFDMWSSP